jgi:hypothetical protein
MLIVLLAAGIALILIAAAGAVIARKRRRPIPHWPTAAPAPPCVRVLRSDAEVREAAERASEREHVLAMTARRRAERLTARAGLLTNRAGD